MIQRKQTLFLLAAIVLLVICMSSQVATFFDDSGTSFAQMYNLWLTDGQGHHSFQSAPLFISLLLTILLSVVNIFLYTRRKLQANLCLVGMFLLVGWYVLLAVLPQSIGGELVLEWPSSLPAVSIILMFLARKGILADEKLVRSLDRIR